MAVSVSDIRVDGITTEQETDSLDRLVEVARIYYTIGTFGPYSVTIPKLELTPQRVLIEVRQDAQRFVDILNLTF